MDVKDSKILSKKVIFDDSKVPVNYTNPITYERAIELEKTMGKAILERLEKEFSKLDKEDYLINSSNSNNL